MEGKKTKFYSIHQNNSGGYFMENVKDGIAKTIIVEEATAEKAIERLLKITKEYRDYCPCCGERWSCCATEEEGTDTPMVYDLRHSKYVPFDEYLAKGEENMFFMFSDTFAVHYLDGRIEWHGDKPKGK